VSYIACGCLTIFAVNKAVSDFFYELEDEGGEIRYDLLVMAMVFWPFALAFMGGAGLGKLLLMAGKLALGKPKPRLTDEEKETLRESGLL
jgi:hypothetical protein